MEKRPKGRPAVPADQKAMQRGVRFEAEVWRSLVALVPERHRSQVINEAVRREVKRLVRLAKKTAGPPVDADA